MAPREDEETPLLQRTESYERRAQSDQLDGHAEHVEVCHLPTPPPISEC